MKAAYIGVGRMQSSNSKEGHEKDNRFTGKAEDEQVVDDDIPEGENVLEL